MFHPKITFCLLCVAWFATLWHNHGWRVLVGAELAHEPVTDIPEGSTVLSSPEEKGVPSSVTLSKEENDPPAAGSTQTSSLPSGAAPADNSSDSAGQKLDSQADTPEATVTDAKPSAPPMPDNEKRDQPPEETATDAKPSASPLLDNEKRDQPSASEDENKEVAFRETTGAAGQSLRTGYPTLGGLHPNTAGLLLLSQYSKTALQQLDPATRQKLAAYLGSLSVDQQQNLLYFNALLQDLPESESIKLKQLLAHVQKLQNPRECLSNFAVNTHPVEDRRPVASQQQTAYLPSQTTQRFPHTSAPTYYGPVGSASTNSSSISSSSDAYLPPPPPASNSISTSSNPYRPLPPTSSSIPTSNSISTSRNPYRPLPPTSSSIPTSNSISTSSNPCRPPPPISSSISTSSNPHRPAPPTSSSTSSSSNAYLPPPPPPSSSSSSHSSSTGTSAYTGSSGVSTSTNTTPSSYSSSSSNSTKPIASITNVISHPSTSTSSITSASRNGDLFIPSSSLLSTAFYPTWVSETAPPVGSGSTYYSVNRPEQKTKSIGGFGANVDEPSATTPRTPPPSPDPSSPALTYATPPMESLPRKGHSDAPSLQVQNSSSQQDRYSSTTHQRISHHPPPQQQHLSGAPPPSLHAPQSQQPIYHSRPSVPHPEQAKQLPSVTQQQKLGQPLQHSYHTPPPPPHPAPQLEQSPYPSRPALPPEQHKQFPLATQQHAWASLPGQQHGLNQSSQHPYNGSTPPRPPPHSQQPLYHTRPPAPEQQMQFPLTEQRRVWPPPEQQNVLSQTPQDVYRDPPPSQTQQHFYRSHPSHEQHQEMRQSPPQHLPYTHAQQPRIYATNASDEDSPFSTEEIRGAAGSQPFQLPQPLLPEVGHLSLPSFPLLDGSAGLSAIKSVTAPLQQLLTPSTAVPPPRLFRSVPSSGNNSSSGSTSPPLLDDTPGVNVNSGVHTQEFVEGPSALLSPLTDALRIVTSGLVEPAVMHANEVLREAHDLNTRVQQGSAQAAKLFNELSAYRAANPEAPFSKLMATLEETAATLRNNQEEEVLVAPEGRAARHLQHVRNNSSNSNSGNSRRNSGSVESTSSHSAEVGKKRNGAGALRRRKTVSSGSEAPGELLQGMEFDRPSEAVVTHPMPEATAVVDAASNATTTADDAAAAETADPSAEARPVLRQDHSHMGGAKANAVPLSSVKADDALSSSGDSVAEESGSGSIVKILGGGEIKYNLTSKDDPFNLSPSASSATTRNTVGAVAAKTESSSKAAEQPKTQQESLSSMVTNVVGATVGAALDFLARHQQDQTLRGQRQ